MFPKAEDFKQDLKENDKVQENEHCSNEFITQGDVKQVLEESGVLTYDQQAVTHLTSYINHYAVGVLHNATTFMKHAGRKTMNLADVKLALDVVNKKSPKRPSYKELIKLAREHNKSELPHCNTTTSFSLPNEGCVLTKCNYKLKATNAQFPLNFPLMDITNRQNQFFTINTLKNHQEGFPTVIRTSPSAMSIGVPLNLNSQRIILQPQTPNPNRAICTSHDRAEDNIKKKMRLEENRK